MCTSPTALGRGGGQLNNANITFNQRKDDENKEQRCSNQSHLLMIFASTNFHIKSRC